ncbi:9668_t:CDS:2 [Entrophospora sp. SA101]|nr:9668_t:CDS:2 [Entrophospora sp. SA101]
MNTLLDQRNNDDNGDGNLNNSSTLTSDEVQITITESALFSPNNISHNNDLNSIDGDFYKANYSDEKLPSYSIISKDMPPNYNKDEEAYEHRHSSNSNGDSHSSCIGNIKPGSWPITKNLYIYGFLFWPEELEEELHYFQIPLSCIWTSLKQRAISYKIDLFVEALRDVYFEILSEFETKVEIKFRRNKLQPHIVTFSSDSSDLICKLILNIINPFESCGYTLLDKFGTEIGCYLKNTIPDLHWELSHVDNFNWYCVKMFSTESFNYESILQNSCLGNNNIHHRIIDD